MRIAVLIIALFLTLLVGLQSCTISAGSALTKDASLYGAGISGIFVALLFLLGAAFVTGLPRVSIVLFAVAAAVGLTAGFRTTFVDLRWWGFVAVILTVMSYFGSRELRKKNANVAPGVSQP